MAEKNKYRIINIRRYIGNENPELGEDELLQILSEFSCPLNPDVERFLKHSSIEFTKKNQSVTYLVFSVVGRRLLGYFTLALKPLTVRGKTVSNTVKRKLLRDGHFKVSKDMMRSAEGLSHAEIAKVCDDAIKNSILCDVPITGKTVIGLLNERKNVYSCKEA